MVPGPAGTLGPRTNTVTVMSDDRSGRAAARGPCRSPDRAGRLGRPLTRSGEGGGCLRAEDGGVPAGHSQLPQLRQQRLESDGYPERRVDPCILAVQRLRRRQSPLAQKYLAIPATASLPAVPETYW